MRTLRNRRIVLIGGAGFIGHNLALYLKESGAEIFTIDNLVINNYYSFINRNFSQDNSDLCLKILQQRLDLLHEHKIPLIQVDSRDYRLLSELIGKLDVDTIIHLAAVAHADKSNKDPYSTFDHSLRTLENALDIARSTKLHIEHFIYFSSSMVYGHFKDGIVTEDSICNPLGIYGALKFAGEKLVIAYHQVFNVPYTIVRPSALYGERCVSKRVAQIFIENGIKGIPLQIQGDGSERLDFTYIDDLVEGIARVLTSENSKNQVFNLTYGQSRSIKEMAEIVKNYFPDLRIEYLPKDRLMPDRGTLSVDRAKKLIGYTPSYPLEGGMAKYIKWYKSLNF